MCKFRSRGDVLYGIYLFYVDCKSFLECCVNAFRLLGYNQKRWDEIWCITRGRKRNCSIWGYFHNFSFGRSHFYPFLYSCSCSFWNYNKMRNLGKRDQNSSPVVLSLIHCRLHCHLHAYQYTLNINTVCFSILARFTFDSLRFF